MAILEEYAYNAQIFSVSALTELIRNDLENHFPFVWVKGEVTDFRLSNNGHIYFSLKDGNSLLGCVLFNKRRMSVAGQKFDPLTGEVFETPRPPLEDLITNGVELICAGGINLYAKSGRYQLVVEHAELAGQGAQALLFEIRKAKYAAAGYFSPERKRKLPSQPERIALVTSPRGAAIHDFMKLAQMRGLSSRIRLFPVTVQGRGAAAKMARAIEEANQQGWADVIVLIRGGGSAEDLAEFNEPVLVEAVYNSILPVLAGIGHEIDVFLTDMTADVRAATPSHAAQILWPLRTDLWQKLDDAEQDLRRAINERLLTDEKRLSERNRALRWFAPELKIERLNTRLKELAHNLRRDVDAILANASTRLERLSEICHHAASLHRKISLDSQKLDWLYKSSSLAIQQKFSACREKLENLDTLGRKNWRNRLFYLGSTLEARTKILESLDPGLPLAKGYALLYKDDRLVKSVGDCLPRERLTAQLRDGRLELNVNFVRKMEE